MKINKETHIEGPITLVELKSDILNKHYYIFGDEHRHEMKCPIEGTPTTRIDNFIEQIIRENKNKVIDLFVELDFPDTQNPTLRDIKYQVTKEEEGIISYLPTTDYLTDIYHKFYDCLQTNKDKCSYTNFRAHYTDVRFIPTNNSIIEYVFKVNDTYRQIQIAKLFFKRPMSTSALRPIIISIINDGIKILDMLPFKIEDAYNVVKIDKQIENIKDENLVSLIYKYFNKKLWGILVKANKEYNSYTEDSDIEEIKTGVNILFDYAVSLMDLYIISRSLRSFKNDEINNIIIYTGNSHSENIIDFLLTLPGMKIIEKSRSFESGVDYQCLDISNFKQPFF